LHSPSESRTEPKRAGMKEKKEKRSSRKKKKKEAFLSTDVHLRTGQNTLQGSGKGKQKKEGKVPYREIQRREERSGGADSHDPSASNKRKIEKKESNNFKTSSITFVRRGLERRGGDRKGKEGGGGPFIRIVTMMREKSGEEEPLTFNHF